MAVRTAARTALGAGLAATALLGGAGTAVAGSSGDAVGHPTWRANAVFVDQTEGIVVDLTVAEAAASWATVTVGLALEGWQCTVDGRPEVADVVRLKSARLVGTFGYTCSAGGGGGQGTVPDTLNGTVVVEVTWTGVGSPVEQPLYDGAVGRYVVRDAEASGHVSVTGGPSSDLEANGAHLARESTVFPPGRLG